MAFKKISIVILNWNGKQDTIECLTSLQEVIYENFDIILVDNGSTDGSLEEIKIIFPNVILLDQKENLGFAKGCNVGAKYALENGADFVCLLNNDTVVDKMFLTNLVNSMKASNDIGVLGAKIMMYSDRSKLDHLGGKWDIKRAEFELIGNRSMESSFAWDDNQDLDYVCGAAFFVKKEVFEKIGFLDERFFLIWEESDFCFRAKKYGFKVRCCTDAIVWHKVSASFKSKSHSTYFWWRNRLLFIERNFEKQEKEIIYKKILKKQILHLYKIKTIKNIELFFLKCFAKKKISAQKLEKLHKYFAAYQGIKDHQNGNYGQGPSWIYQKPADFF